MTPKIEGPHELAWSMILDLIYSDAYRHNIAHIRSIVGIEGVQQGIALREKLTRQEGNRCASAWLCQEGISDTENRLYTVEMKNRIRPDASIWQEEKSYYVFTLKARYLGVLIRTARWLNKPEWEDAAMYKMRKEFISDRRTSAFYTLKVWTRKGELA